MQAVPKDTESAFLRKVGKRIKALREERQMSQSGLAVRSGVNRQYLWGIEKGVRNITLLRLEQIARILKVSPAALLED